MDQDAINLIAVGKVLHIAPNWNFQWHRMLDGSVMPFQKEAYDAAMADPFIIHYTSSKKPWKYPDYRFAELFWKYATQVSMYPIIFRKLIDFQTSTQASDRSTSSKKSKKKIKWLHN